VSDNCPSQAYITGNAFVVLEPPTTLLQTVYDEDPSFLTAIAFDEATGKIATCTERSVRIYRPYGQNEEALKVSRDSTPNNDISNCC
jgi:hypothetical protein